VRPGTRVAIAHPQARRQTFRLESDIGESVTVTSEQTSQTYQVDLGYLRPAEPAGARQGPDDTDISPAACRNNPGTSTR
jgi:hypothetical protein